MSRSGCDGSWVHCRAMYLSSVQVARMRTGAAEHGRHREQGDTHIATEHTCGGRLSSSIDTSTGVSCVDVACRSDTAIPPAGLSSVRSTAHSMSYRLSHLSSTPAPQPVCQPPSLSADVSSPCFSSAGLFSPVVGSTAPPSASSQCSSFQPTSPLSPPILQSPYDQLSPVLPSLSLPPLWTEDPVTDHAQPLHPPLFTNTPPSQPLTLPTAQPVLPADILVRRHKQRRADAQRRKREAAALGDLKQLMAAAEAHTSSGRRREGGDEADEKQQRVHVLEGTAQEMRHLLRLVEALKQTCETLKQHSNAVPTNTVATTRRDNTDHIAWNLNDRANIAEQPFDSYAAPSNSSSSKRVRLLATAVSRSLDASLGHSTLASLRSLPVTVAALLINCDDGTALDMNDGMLHYGWERSELLGRQFCAPYEWLMGDESSYSGPLSDAQYERSKRLKRQLYTGESGKCVASWRIQFACGSMHEVVTTSWIDGWREVQDSAGGVSRRPLRTVVVTSLADIMPID